MTSTVTVKSLTERFVKLGILNEVNVLLASYGTLLDDVVLDGREKHVVRGRAALMYFLRMRFKMSNPSIGKLLGRDPSTVLTSVRRFLEAPHDEHPPSPNRASSSRDE